MHMEKPLIGFIGQGWIGRNYADDFESRGLSTVRYALEAPYRENKEKIKDCDIVFIAVPTPSTPDGFDSRIVESGLALVGEGKVAVIKSTVIPGSTKKFQEQFPNIIVVYSPEFLSVSTAAYDAAHPFANTIGLPIDDEAHRAAADDVFAVLAESPYTFVCTSSEAELIKYSHNVSAYSQIVTFNMLYDLAEKLGCDWNAIHNSLQVDPYICSRYAQPIHKSGRGAGGGCFIKDFAAFRELYEKTFSSDTHGMHALRALECKNIDLLMESKKDLEFLHGVYGDNPEQICGA